MTKKKNTKKALITSMISLMLCVTMLVGSTYAWFTDSVTSAGNIITSGTLDVTMHWAEGTANPDTAEWKDASTGAMFTHDKWEPGYVDVKHIKIANVGSLALKYQISIVANGAVSALSDVIDVYYTDPAEAIASRTELIEEKKLGTLTDVLAGIGETGYGQLPAGEDHTITLALKMQESAGNDYQNKSIGTSFSVQLQATQLTAEDDSFDDQYDKDAEYDYVSAPAVLTGNAGAPVALKSPGSIPVEVNLPINLVNNLYAGGTTELRLVHTTPKVDETAGNVTFDSVELVDQDGNVVELEGNIEPIPVSLPVSFANGTTVFIYHDNEKVATVTVENGQIAYECNHFCKVTLKSNELYVGNAKELQAAIDTAKMLQGNELGEAVRIVLTEDIVFDADSEFVFTDSNGAHLYLYHVNVILDLNGHDIKATAEAVKAGKSEATALLLVRYSNLDIVGEGDIITENKAIPVYAWAHSTVDIYGGNYISNAVERKESAIYVNNTSAKINVYGGTYTDSAFGFNAHNTSCTETVITIYEGIVFNDYQNHFDADYNAGRISIAEGCVLKSEKIDGTTRYTVCSE